MSKQPAIRLLQPGHNELIAEGDGINPASRQNRVVTVEKYRADFAHCDQWQQCGHNLRLVTLDIDLDEIEPGQPVQMQNPFRSGDARGLAPETPGVTRYETGRAGVQRRAQMQGAVSFLVADRGFDHARVGDAVRRHISAQDGGGPGGVSNLNAQLISVPYAAGAYAGQCVNLIGNNYSNAINQGLPLANILVRTGSFPPAVYLPVNSIGEAISSGLQRTLQHGNNLTVSSGTITITTEVHHVSSPATLTTISLPTALNYGSLIDNTRCPRITLIANGGTLTVNTGGNIGAATSIANGAAMDFIYVPSLSTWYPVL